MYRLSSVLTSGGVGMSNAFPVASPKSICVRSPFKHGMGPTGNWVTLRLVESLRSRRGGAESEG